MTIDSIHSGSAGRRAVRRGFGCLVVLAVIAAVSVSAQLDSGMSPHFRLAAACASTQSPGADLGLAFGAEINDMSQADSQRLIDAAASLGVRRVRLGLDWTDIEVAPGVYNWSRTDYLVSTARAEGADILGIILTTPVWARDPAALTTFHSMPARASDLGNFAAVAAKRYASSISDWEIWNEPNNPAFAAPAPSVARYVEMLSAASTAIRSVEPSATIVTGGLAPAGDTGGWISPLTFVEQLYSIGDRAQWDAVGMHPYTYPYLPNDPASAGWNAFQRMQLMHNVMAANGDGAKRIWMTEFGAPTSTNEVGVSTSAQSQAISKAVGDMRTTSYLGPLFIHSLRDSGTDPQDVEQNFGLLRDNWSQKPAFRTLSNLARSC